MAWRSTASRKTAALGAAVLALGPTLIFAHERWVKHDHLPFDRAYFRSMSGQVLGLSLLATASVAMVIVVWYTVAAKLGEQLELPNQEARDREARRPLVVRAARLLVRFLCDGEIDNDLFRKGQTVTAFVFAKIPALVLGLGVYQGWLIMPSFPLSGTLGQVLRVVEAALAAWVLVGLWQRALGIVMLLAFVYLIFGYGIASIDAVPVLASAFFYLFAKRGIPVTSRQLAGIRVSLGIGFMLLGLVNKIYHAELFIGVGDQYPHLLDGARALVPGLTREAWSFGTALGEISFGMLLLVGVFDKITTMALTMIFTSFVFTFGMAEIVHLYPIAGFAVLFFRAPPGTAIDGALFRTHVWLWRRFGHRSDRGVYTLALVIVALATATLLVFGPLLFFVEILPRIAG